MIEDNPFTKVVDDFPTEFRDKIFEFVSFKLKTKAKLTKVKPKAPDDYGYGDEDFLDEDLYSMMAIEPEFLEKMKDFRRRCYDDGRVNIKYDDFEEWERFLQNIFKSSFPQDFWDNLSTWAIIMGDIPQIERMIKKYGIAYIFDRVQMRFIKFSKDSS